MGLCADRMRGGSAVSDYVLGWLGDPRRQSDNVPLRLAGARHAWRIEGLALEGVYPSQEGEDEALWAAVEPTLLRFPKRIVLFAAKRAADQRGSACGSDPSCACAYRGAFWTPA